MTVVTASLQELLGQLKEPRRVSARKVGVRTPAQQDAFFRKLVCSMHPSMSIPGYETFYGEDIINALGALAMDLAMQGSSDIVVETYRADNGFLVHLRANDPTSDSDNGQETDIETLYHCLSPEGLLASYGSDGLSANVLVTRAA